MNPQDSQSIDQLLLEVRSDKYGDTGNYNTVTLKQAIEAYVTTRVKEATDEPYAILRGLKDRLLEAKKQGRQYIRVSNLEYSIKEQLQDLTTTTNGKEE